jgi:hypothetical protein
MKWIKKGNIFQPNHNFEWMVSHASIPVVDRIDQETLRIYFGTRDEKGRSITTYLLTSSEEPKIVKYLHDAPILPLGRLGTFDDNGIMPSWLVNHGNVKYLYYIGWNPQITVSYRLSIGLAISEDNGLTFSKISEGPIMDRAIDEPYFNTAPCVIIENHIWRMWYVSCTGWDIINNHPEPFYQVKYAESADGIHWRRTGKVCIDYDEFTQAIARPCVFKDQGLYRMIYSYRSTINYRNDPNQSYRLGYAESLDGLEWIRNDEEVGIDRSTEGWDSQMIEYSFYYLYKDKKYLFYNGDGFGKTGFGYAILQE